MKEIVLASGNRGKIAEFNAMLAPVSVISPKDLGLDFDVEETGKTFFENALIKARALYELDGAPGVYSARYSGGSDADNVAKLLKTLEGKTDRKAHFTSCIVYYDGERTVDAYGHTYGEIALAPEGDNGFGYDPVFVSDDLKKSFGVADEIEKMRVTWYISLR